MLRASCLCDSNRFELGGELRAARYCYCEHCTRYAGTAPAAWVMANAADVRHLERGDVSKYDSGRGLRCFCSNCGSPLWFESKDFPEIVMLPLGVFEDGPVPQPEMHIFVDSRPEWCVIRDDLPQHRLYPDG